MSWNLKDFWKRCQSAGGVRWRGSAGAARARCSLRVACTRGVSSRRGSWFNLCFVGPALCCAHLEAVQAWAHREADWSSSAGVCVSGGTAPPRALVVLGMGWHFSCRSSRCSDVELRRFHVGTCCTVTTSWNDVMEDHSLGGSLWLVRQTALAWGIRGRHLPQRVAVEPSGNKCTHASGPQFQRLESTGFNSDLQSPE